MTYLFKPYDGEVKNDTGNPLPISKNTTANSNSNPMFVEVTAIPEVEVKNDAGNPLPVEWVYGNGATIIPWQVQVARGLIAGVSGLSISGYNASVDNTFRPLWHYGDRSYTYFPSAQVVRIWSSSASDTDVSVLITGLDSNYALQTETVVLTNGATGVLSTKQFLRVNAISLTRTPMNAGLITAGSSDKSIELAHIEIGAGRSQMTVYTVPAGYTFYLSQSQWYTNNTGNNTALYRSYTQSASGLVNTILTFPFPTEYNSVKIVPRPYPEKTDIQWQAASNSGTTRIGGQIEGYLISSTAG